MTVQSSRTTPAQPIPAQARALPTAPSTVERWFPIAAWLPRYKWGEFFVADLIAAVSVAALLIPESMGYSAVAGVPVEVGLYAAPLALIGYALFGGSKLLVFAAASATAAISASVVGTLSGGDPGTAVALTVALALTTGAVFIIAGLIGLGWVTNFMSKAVMAGFITGMAIQIIVGQLGKLFGVEVIGSNTLQKLWSAISQLADWNWMATAIGLTSLLLLFMIPRYFPKLPAALVTVVLSSAIVAFLNPELEVVAEIPQGLPSLTFPAGIDVATWLSLLGAGALVALVGFSEGWGASAGLSRKTHDSLDTNQEFRAYGFGNLGAGLLGGMVTTGSLSKSAAAMEAGAKTQMTNILLAGIVLLVLAFFAPLFQWLPETALAAIVIAAVSEHARPHKLAELWRTNRVDFVWGLLTFFCVLVFDLLPALIAGIVFSILYVIYRISFPPRVVLGRVPSTGDFQAMNWFYGGHRGSVDSEAEAVPGIIVYRFAGPLIFANAQAFKQTGELLLIEAAAKGELPHALVLDFEQVVYVDNTGAAALTELFTYAKRYDVDLVLARVHLAARDLLDRTGVTEIVGEQRFYGTVRKAVQAAKGKIDQKLA